MIADLMERKYRIRKWKSRIMSVLLVLASFAALAPLISIFEYILAKGLPALNWSFFTQLPKPVGEVGGGMAHALIGTLVLIFLASMIGIAWGIATGVYLSEYARGKRSQVIRFCVDILASTPSIVIGLFAYAVLVVPIGHFSALSGGVALGILMIPTVARTTEEVLKLVPIHIREAGLALGIPRWKVIVYIVLRGSLRAITTGVMLAVGRVAGETAPLLFTAFGNQFWNLRLDRPIASLPLQIYTFAISPYEDWHRQAWAGAFVLVMVVFILNLFTRLLLSQESSGSHE